jgi:RNA polymerase sigma factor (sigma-70 family)
MDLIPEAVPASLFELFCASLSSDGYQRVQNPCHRRGLGCINWIDDKLSRSVAMFSERRVRARTELQRSADLPDGELVQACRRGDKRAFVEIVARHQAMVCGIALGILGDFAASEDAAQEAFLTAWRQLGDLREPERLRGWLGQIARNAALMHLRRKRGDDTSEEDLALLVDDSPGPDEAAANADEAALVRAFLARLPEAYRLPLVLYYREGKSASAVAEALSLSEDAVKQRLSRGREMLRDRMSGMVETVLVRTRPTTAFTITVAVAIGALAAPAAIASGVFTAAGTTTATSSTSALVTAMSTSKTVLVTAALVAFACVPVGYHLYSGSGAPAVAGSVPAIPARNAGGVTNAPPTFETSALFAEWRALHERCGTNAAAMPALYKAISDLKDPFRRRAFRAALAAEWAQVDPAGGFKFHSGKGPDATERRQFFEEWLARDPRAAVEALMGGGKAWADVARDCLPEIARQVPDRVPAIASNLPGAESYWDSNVRDAFAVLAEGGLDAARQAAEGVTGPNREQALAGVARIWARADLDAALAWAKALPQGAERDETMRAVLIGKAAVDPVTALELVGTVPSGGRHAHFADTTGAKVLNEAASADFDTTVAWVAAHPGLLGGREDLYGLRDQVANRLNADPAGFLSAHATESELTALRPAIENALLNQAGGQRAAVWDWLKSQPDSEVVKGLKEDALHTAAWQDPMLAMQWVADLPHTPDGEAQVKELARCLFNGGNELCRFNALMAQAPDRLRQPLVDAAFTQCLSPSYLDDPQLWVSRLPLLNDTSRSQGIRALASAWGTQNPEEAVAWATTLAQGENRNGALGAIASAWAAKDARGAAQWVASLPAGAERDQSAQSLVGAMAETYPRQAWDWALSIGDTAQRSQAAAQAVKAVAARDPATARQWITTGPFTPTTRAELEATLSANQK